jgi:hypothetical protein
MKQIFYRKRKHYKYTLQQDCAIKTKIKPYAGGTVGCLSITPEGRLKIKKGYVWDGPSGPTIDTWTFMRASLVHDALYQLIREGLLPLDSRVKADELLRKMCLEDGMSRMRAWWVYRAVRAFGHKSIKSDILKAPN